MKFDDRHNSPIRPEVQIPTSVEEIDSLAAPARWKDAASMYTDVMRGLDFGFVSEIRLYTAENTVGVLTALDDGSELLTKHAIPIPEFKKLSAMLLRGFPNEDNSPQRTLLPFLGATDEVQRIYCERSIRYPTEDGFFDGPRIDWPIVSIKKLPGFSAPSTPDNNADLESEVFAELLPRFRSGAKETNFANMELLAAQVAQVLDNVPAEAPSYYSITLLEQDGRRYLELHGLASVEAAKFYRDYLEESITGVKCYYYANCLAAEQEKIRWNLAIKLGRSGTES
ncbi:MAG: hypothetical protein KDD70_00855 [Bdellovibrionales bacterium]|nr:hypothetical protein [Bdellovibrionales bacterium]